MFGSRTPIHRSLLHDAISSHDVGSASRPQPSAEAGSQGQVMIIQVRIIDQAGLQTWFVAVCGCVWVPCPRPMPHPSPAHPPSTKSHAEPNQGPSCLSERDDDCAMHKGPARERAQRASARPTTAPRQSHGFGHFSGGWQRRTADACSALLDSRAAPPSVTSPGMRTLYQLMESRDQRSEGCPLMMGVAVVLLVGWAAQARWVRR